MAMTQLKSKIIGTRISSYYKRLLFMARPTGRTHSRTVIAKSWKHSVLLPVEHHQLSYSTSKDQWTLLRNSCAYEGTHLNLLSHLVAHSFAEHIRSKIYF